MWQEIFEFARNLPIVHNPQPIRQTDAVFNFVTYQVPITIIYSNHCRVLQNSAIISNTFLQNLQSCPLNLLPEVTDDQT